MTSLLTEARQLSLDSGYFIPVGNCAGKIFEYNAASATQFSTAAWATTGVSTAYLVSSAGLAVLRDMGKTVVSSTRTFRKVQLVVSSAWVTGGTSGFVNTGGEDYFTGYIELGFGGGPMGAPVAKYGR